MIVSPDYESFAKAYEQGRAQIVSTRLVALFDHWHESGCDLENGWQTGFH
jgi:hypothetical protein